MAGKIAYIMSRFPHLPETFILREMDELTRQGWPITLYPLVIQQEPIVHAEAERWLPKLQAVPFISRSVLASNGRALKTRTGATTRLWLQALQENLADPHMLARAAALLPKATAVAETMQAENVTHIHAHYASHPAFFAWLLHQMTGISYSVTVHAHDIFVRHTMLATKLRAARFVVAISQYNREYLARVVGLWIQDKTHVVHCGIRPEFYLPRPIIGDKRPLQILNIGSLQPYKGQTYLIEACALLKAEGIPFQCHIIGGGEEQTRLEQLINHRQLTKEVHLLGPLPQDEVAARLPQANCYVQPSIVTPSGKMEGIPVALMEALACQVPVIATEISGIPELVQDGQTGYLVPPADSASLARALTHVYETPAAAAATAVAGRDLVLRQFNLEQNVKTLASLFERYSENKRVPFYLQSDEN